MALSERSRTTIYQTFEPLLGDEVVSDMLSYFPARDLEEPVTKEFLRAELAEFRTQIRAELAEFKVVMSGEMAEFKVVMRGEMAEFKGGVTGEMAEFKGGVTGEINKLRGEMNTGFEKMGKEFHQDQVVFMRLLIGSQFVLAVLFALTQAFT